MKLLGKFVSAAAVFTIFAPSLNAAVKLNSLFCDHMVLQRDQANPVWGWADAGEHVTVSLGQSKVETTAGADGKWSVKLPPQTVGGPALEMTVAGSNSITIHDILIGEVWFCSGQSNMDFTVSKSAKRSYAGVRDEQNEVADANHPLIRLYSAEWKMSDDPQPDTEGKWQVCSPETVGDFSAAAYFFGRELQQKLNVPVGLIVCAYGASTCQAWISHDTLAASEEFAPMLDAYAKLKSAFDPVAAKAKYETALAKWEKDDAAAKAKGEKSPKKPGELKGPTQDQHNPCVLFNGMVAPVAGYGIRGAIWYQGESNGIDSGSRYARLQNTMVRNWRSIWNQGDFPFIYVQLPAYKAAATQPEPRAQIARFRQGQTEALSEPNTAMAVIVDIGDAKNIHPKNKQEAGRRIGLVAEEKVYKLPVQSSGPVMESAAVEGSTAVVKFTHGQGLNAKDGKVTGFTLGDDTGKLVWADAKIDGDRVIVSSNEIQSPTSVSYGWADNPPVSLYNDQQLPAWPFWANLKPASTERK